VYDDESFVVWEILSTEEDDVSFKATYKIHRRGCLHDGALEVEVVEDAVIFEKVDESVVKLNEEDNDAIDEMETDTSVVKMLDIVDEVGKMTIGLLFSIVEEDDTISAEIRVEEDTVEGTATEIDKDCDVVDAIWLVKLTSVIDVESSLSNNASVDV
jgi:hypothetical protein